jgi:sigma-B regulation protein RsbU (phosphoserine phosphatase)
MGILTVILTAVSQLVLRYSIVLPLKKVTAEQERIATELSLGADIQKSMLPESVPCRFGKEGAVSVYGFMEPAKETGGDFFDYFLLDDDHLALVIADVSGKGVPAALFMMMCQIFIDSFAANGYSPGEALARANDEICSRNRKRMFVTVWLGVLELSSGRLTAANAGHEYPVIRRDGGDFGIISDPHGLMAGCFKGTDYESYDIQLDKGDVLFVHTDGLTEATNAEKKLLGAERMVEALNELPADAEPETVCIHMKETVERFAGDTPQYDDLTMLCVRMEK